MAQRVTISSIGATPPVTPRGITGQALVDHMIKFWQGQLHQVLPDKPDLIVLPEMCDRYSDHNPQQAVAFRSTRGEQMLEFLQGVARGSKCYIAYTSNREARDGTWRNSTLMLDRAGQVAGIYSKNHVVISETTDYNILCGANAPLIQCDFGRVAVAICFDLNFDELRLKYKALKPVLIVSPSMCHGGLMQPYWAYSCRAHFVGCTSIINLPSEIYSPVGHRIATSTNYFNFVTARVNLDCQVAHLDGNWDKLAELKNKYGAGVTIFDPGKLASVLVTSETVGVSALQMAHEFEIELLDHFMERSLAHHHNPRNIAPLE